MDGLLPIHDVLPALRHALRDRSRVVLEAPPGAGKTTRVPLAILHEEWLRGRRIIMLEPRRLAARAAAAFMARLLGEDVGATVGYRVRLDSRVGPRTRIEVVTEGILTRMLQDDPALEDAGIIIFDEFHERSIHADLGLALTLQSQALLRPDLRLLVMSATLDAAPLVDVLDDPVVVRSEGRSFPVDTRYVSARTQSPIEAVAAATTRRALDEHDGDILVFLPGAAEIGRTAARLADADLPRNVSVIPLFGDLPQDEQDRAIAPSPPGTRKVVLATAIAETSLTIEGVRVVVDSGLVRAPRFSPRSGMTRLVTVPVSRSGADQRRGRAGRVAPGTCYRLWTEAEHAALLAHRPPEILEADLAGLALELAAWGIHDPQDLRWIDPPPTAAFAQALELLAGLDALDDTGRITPHGRRVATLAIHPRLAHMLLRSTEPALAAGRGGGGGSATGGGADGSIPALACDLAALLAERDVLRHGAGRDGHAAGADPDIRVRLPLLRGEAPPRGEVVDRAAVRRVRAEAAHWRSRLRVPRTASAAGVEDAAGMLLSLAYPDRVGQQRGGRGRFVLRNGRGAAVDASHNMAGAEFVAAADVGGRGRDSRIFLGAPLTRAEVETLFADRITTSLEVSWDGAARTVRAMEVRRLGALLLGSRPARDVPRDFVTGAVLDAVRRDGLATLGWSGEAERLRERLAFLHASMPEDWPDVSDSALLARLDEWLLPWLEAGSGDAPRIDPVQALLGIVSWQRRSLIDELAPTHVEVPSGSRIPIDYGDPAAPVLAVRLQEMFGLADTPRIGGGRVPLLLHLLSPARRPVQVTRDLASFWRTGYFDVRRDLRGRYPKHYWPDDPLQAEPTRRTRPR